MLANNLNKIPPNYLYVYELISKETSFHWTPESLDFIVGSSLKTSHEGIDLDDVG